MLGLVVLIVECSYLFIVSAGTLTDWPTYQANYDLQADGFRSGHLYLSRDPSPRLLARPNPYDRVNRPLWIWDISLYKKRFYMYWGPFPALVLALVKASFHVKKQVGDQYPCFAFHALYALSGALLIDRMARRMFSRIPIALVALAVLVFAFGNPVPFILATAGIYQAAIMGAQAFLVLGLVLAFDAVWKASTGRGPHGGLLAASACWAIAIACRVSVAPTIALLAMVTVGLAYRTRSRSRAELAADLGCVGAPLLVSAFGLLLFNRLRFGEWLEFGTTWQLSTMKFRTSQTYVLANLQNYFLRPMVPTCRFPFVTTPWHMGRRAYAPGPGAVAGYMNYEAVAGMLRAVPLSWLAGAGLLVLPWTVLGVCSRPPGRGVSPRTRARIWGGASFAILGTVTALPFIALFIPTMRYLADVSGGIVLLGIWTAWLAYARARNSPWLRRGIAATFAVLSLLTVVIGVLLGFQGDHEHFQRHNPALWKKLQSSLSWCAR